MRLIKLAIISFIIIFLVVTAISLMIPAQVRISRAINLHTDNHIVFALIKNEAQWPLWHPAYKDSVAAKSWRAMDKKLVENSDSAYILQLQQKDRKAVTSAWIIHRYQHSDSTTLQWYLDFQLSWLPWDKFSSMFYEKTYGVMMEQGLSNIKQQISSGEAQ